jgi:hypothetical protein
MKNRPKGILFVTAFMFFLAAGALIAAISTLFPGTPLDVLWVLNNSFPQSFRFTTTAKILAIIMLIFSLILTSAGWGLLKGQKWAWWLILILFTVAGIGFAVRIALGSIEGVVGVLVSSGIIFYLNRPGVRKFFKTKKEL